jgi:predicted amidophosphoribosyltransferase
MDGEIAPSRSALGHLRDSFGLLRSGIRQATKLALDIALPTLCVACREPVDGEGVCAGCWAYSPSSPRPIAPSLASPLSMTPVPTCCRWRRSPIRRPMPARAAVRYDEVARTLVHGLKYQDRTDLSPIKGRWMARAGCELLDRADMPIPVLLHWRRAWHRRYNQSGRSRASFRSKAASNCAATFWRGSAPPSSRSGSRAPSGRAMCRAHLRYLGNDGAR